MFIKQSYKVSLVVLAIVFRSTADRIPIKYICSYHCWDGIRHVSLLVGANYGEEMHQLVKNFIPETRLFETIIDMVAQDGKTMKQKCFESEFSKSQVSRPRV
jgi:hypothetical protein